jgi:transcriptional regulator with XRE-family HTH domain
MSIPFLNIYILFKKYLSLFVIMLTDVTYCDIFVTKEVNKMIGNRFRQLREEREMTQADCAEKFIVSRSTIAMWEANEREPDDVKKIEIAKYFDVTVDYLIEKSNERGDDIDLDKVNIGMSREQYNTLTEVQKQQIRELIKIITK